MTMRGTIAWVLALGVLAPAAAMGQDAGNTDWLELLRSDLRTEKVGIMTEAMQLSDAEAEVFWPLYREYEKEFAAIGDRRIALIKEYAQNYSHMSQEAAKQISDDWFRLQDDKMKLKKKYFKKVEKALSTAIAARFVQIEHQIGLLVDLQITSEMPLIKAPSGGS